jgi:hypothetical protein
MAAQQRWPAFSLSLIFHVGAVGLVLWIDIAFAPPASPRYEVLPIPDKAPPDSKIVWYDFRKNLPDVTPDHSFGPSVTPHGEKDPTQTLVTVSPDASSTRQLIRRPDQPKLLAADVPAPNLVALEVKLPPKTFVPPAPPKQPKTVAIGALDTQPSPLEKPTLQTGNALGAMTSLQKLPPKPFVAPPAQSAAAKPAPHVDAPVSSSPDLQASQIAGLQAVMIGLNPAATLPPPGSRPAQIARAPEAGAPSSGTVTGANASIVPGVLSHGKAGEIMPPGSAQAPTTLPRPVPQEIVLPGVNRTMSAPLRPSSRVIPASVEARFSHQNVYTLVIPGPAVPGYAGDWVMWFAEHDPPEISSGARISAPIPARKYSTVNVESGAPGVPAAYTVQFAAAIDKAGHIGSAALLRGPVDPVFRRWALDELASWEFKPALRNGEPIETDVVIEISFRSQSPSQ